MEQEQSQQQNRNQGNRIELHIYVHISNQSQGDRAPSATAETIFHHSLEPLLLQNPAGERSMNQDPDTLTITMQVHNEQSSINMSQNESNHEILETDSDNGFIPIVTTNSDKSEQEIFPEQGPKKNYMGTPPKYSEIPQITSSVQPAIIRPQREQQLKGEQLKRSLDPRLMCVSKIGPGEVIYMKFLNQKLGEKYFHTNLTEFSITKFTKSPHNLVGALSEARNQNITLVSFGIVLDIDHQKAEISTIAWVPEGGSTIAYWGTIIQIPAIVGEPFLLSTFSDNHPQAIFATDEQFTVTKEATQYRPGDFVSFWPYKQKDENNTMQTSASMILNANALANLVRFPEATKLTQISLRVQQDAYIQTLRSMCAAEAHCEAQANQGEINNFLFRWVKTTPPCKIQGIVNATELVTQHFKLGTEILFRIDKFLETGVIDKVEIQGKAALIEWTLSRTASFQAITNDMTSRKGLASIKVNSDDTEYSSMGNILRNFMSKGRAELGSENRVALMQLLLGAHRQAETATNQQLQFTPKPKAWESDLNESQMNAYRLATSDENHAIAIRGPPGTGKSTVILRIILQLIDENPETHILVIAPSNAAADTITSKFAFLISHKPELEHSCLRIYAKTRLNQIPAECAQFALHEIINNLDKHAKLTNEEMAQFTKWQDLNILLEELEQLTPQRWAEKSISDSAQKICKEVHRRYQALVEIFFQSAKPKIVVTTISCAKKNILLNWYPTVIIADEAGQINMAELLTTADLIRLSAQKPKLIAVGDENQLERMVFSRGEVAKLAKESLLNRVNRIENFPLITLTINYRTDPVILQYVNAIIYQNIMESGKPESENNTVQLLPMPKNKWPVAVLHCEGPDQKSFNESRFNTEESYLIARLIRLYHSHNLPLEDMVVLAAYDAQKIQIEKALETIGVPKRTGLVITIDGAQSQEYKLAIIATTRSAEAAQENLEELASKKLLGFLDNTNRFAVAMSRAREALIIVGNTRILSKSPHWSQAISMAQYQNAFFEQYEQQLELLEGDKGLTFHHV